MLAKAFEEITGIKVNHQILGEGEVVQAVQTQMQTNRNLYDGYINDSDLIGTHSRLQSAVNLTDWMAGEGKDVTNPMLDVDDFMGKSFTTGPDGKLWQLPDQQFANLYWFRKDWFDRPDLKEKFKAKYGYELGVPVNWSAYEDIADFFTNDVKEIDGVKRLRPHGLRQARARSRLAHDRRLAVDGRRSRRRPAERPPGRRVGHPHGEGLLQPGRRLGVARRRHQQPGGRLCGHQVGRVAAQIRASRCGRPRLLPVAAGAGAGQRRPADLLVHGLHRLHGGAEGARATTPSTTRAMPLWRMAPSPHGPYWKEGSQRGYQDVGSWTLFNSTPVDRRKAAWLYAQFVVSKTVDVKKSQVGLTFIRDSTVRHKSFTERAPKLGGLIEFYRSPDRVAWTPTGINVPDYPKLAQLFWENIGDVNSGAFTPQQAMDRLAEQMDQVMAPHAGGGQEEQGLSRLRSAAEPGEGPERSGSSKPTTRPWAKLDNEKPQGRDHRL